MDTSGGVGRGASLLEKIGLILLLSLGGSIASVAVFARYLERTKDDVRWSTAAGRQLARAVAVREWSRMVESGQDEDRAGLASRIGEFALGLESLERGGADEAGRVAPVAAELRPPLAAVRAVWGGLRPDIDAAARASRGAPGRRAAFARAGPGLERLIRESAAFVAAVDARAASLREAAVRDALAILALIGLLCLAGIALARRFVILPVLRLGAATARVAAGDFSRRLDAAGDDELAALARSFDAMTAEIIRRRALEEKLLQSEKLAAVGQLAAGVAHELNNPLGVILGFADALARRLPGDGGPTALPVASIRREALRCKNLILDLLSFSRQPRSEEMERLDVRRTVEEALTLVGARARQCGVELVAELAPVEARAGRQRLQQVVVNLCNNAIDAMPRGGRLTVRVSRLGSQAELIVADTGDGMSEEVRARLFEPFFTTKEPGKGTGLGLALVHDIVEKHGGTISVDSAPGRGTSFRVLLPAPPAAALNPR